MQRGRRRTRRNQHAWEVGSPCPLDGDIPRMPRGRPLFLQRFVVLVEYDDRAQVSARRPHSTASSDDHIDASGRSGPLFGVNGSGVPGLAEPDGKPAGLVDRRVDDQHRAATERFDHDCELLGRRRQSNHSRKRRVVIADTSPSRRGRQRADHGRRAGSNQQRSEPSGRPAMSCPSRQIQRVGGGADTRPLRQWNKSGKRNRSVGWAE